MTDPFGSSIAAYAKVYLQSLATPLVSLHIFTVKTKW